MGTVCVGLGFSCRHLCHASDATTPESGVLVAVAPTINCTLNETTLAPQAGVELCKRPTDGVALGLIMETVALVRVFGAACAGVNTVLGLEIRRKLINVDRLYVASNCVLHLDAIARVLKSDPLNTVLVLANNEWCCCRNRTRRSVGVDTWAARRSLVHVWCANWRSLRLLLWRAET